MRFLQLFRVCCLSIGSTLFAGLAQPSAAEGLRVTPVMLEVTAPGAQTTLTLRNTSRQPITVQTRVFRWQQTGGEEQLLPTREVVASPPITQIPPGGVQSVRLVRVIRSQIRGEEAYRLLVDEVPDISRQRSGTVEFATRLSIPAFFIARGSSAPTVSWSTHRRGNAMMLEATNSGQQHLRLADLQLRRGGKLVYRDPGLFGYVLGGSTMRWPLGSASRIGGGALQLKANTNSGDYNATVSGR